MYREGKDWENKKRNVGENRKQMGASMLAQFLVSARHRGHLSCCCWFISPSFSIVGALSGPRSLSLIPRLSGGSVVIFKRASSGDCWGKRGKIRYKILFCISSEYVYYVYSREPRLRVQDEERIVEGRPKFDPGERSVKEEEGENNSAGNKTLNGKKKPQQKHQQELVTSTKRSSKEKNCNSNDNNTNTNSANHNNNTNVNAANNTNTNTSRSTTTTNIQKPKKKRKKMTKEKEIGS